MMKLLKMVVVSAITVVACSQSVYMTHVSETNGVITKMISKSKYCFNKQECYGLNPKYGQQYENPNKYSVNEMIAKQILIPITIDDQDRREMDMISVGSTSNSGSKTQQSAKFKTKPLLQNLNRNTDGIHVNQRGGQIGNNNGQIGYNNVQIFYDDDTVITFGGKGNTQTFNANSKLKKRRSDDDDKSNKNTGVNGEPTNGVVSPTDGSDTTRIPTSIPYMRNIQAIEAKSTQQTTNTPVKQAATKKSKSKFPLYAILMSLGIILVAALGCFCWRCRKH